MESEFSEFLNAYSALIQAIATVVLVFLTAYYVRQVKRSAIELEQTRKSEFLPMLSIRVESSGPSSLDVYLSNIGHGIAQHAKVSLPFEKEKSVTEAIAKGQENVLVSFNGIGTAEIMELPAKDRKLRVRYHDIFGRIVVSEAGLVGDEAEDGEPKKESLALSDWHIITPHED